MCQRRGRHGAECYPMVRGSAYVACPANSIGRFRATGSPLPAAVAGNAAVGNSVEPGIWRMQASCLRTLRRRRRAERYPAAISRAGAGPASEAAAR
ncbi:Hypothetical protein SCV20265_0475 [Pseudomonas aeruginosa SCV20265]|nr:Hypothetical protein SCV20265_0475 [Pseudomonas aeruginosa SCV20265]